MVNHPTLLQQDLNYVWHSCAQMKDFELHPPLLIERAQGSYLYTDRGPIIDAISSWWCKSLGHGFPAVQEAIAKQLDSFSHTMGADTTYPAIIELAKTIHKISGLQYTLFANDGSSAVEIALKLALHAAQIKDQPTRKHFIALKNGYHGETLGALSVSDLGIYKAPYPSISVNCYFLENIPYVSGKEDPLWHDCSPIWSLAEKELERIKENVCALILEPIVQGAGGILCYSADFLRKLAGWAKKNDIYLIADEIMTGIGRTGKWLASHHAGIQPDLICLSKGLTSGTLPLSTVSMDKAIYDLFYDDYTAGKSFLHSHTFGGNALAVSAALATLKTIENENILQQAETLGDFMHHCFSEMAAKSGKITNIRSMGAIVAGDLIDSTIPRLGFRLRREAFHQGAFLRPIGNTLYWLPPLNTDRETIEKLTEITFNVVNKIYL